MQQRKRFNFLTVVSFITIGVLLFVNVGFVAVYHVSKMRWYHQQLEAKENEETVTLYLTHEQFESCRVKEHEWKIDGEMYDMRSYESTGSGVVMIAVHDEDENELIAILTAGFDYEDDESSPIKQWLKVFNQPAVATSQHFVAHIFFNAEIKHAIIICRSHLHENLVDRPPLG